VINTIVPEMTAPANSVVATIVMRARSDRVPHQSPSQRNRGQITAPPALSTR
jgi:hypothetical protein